MKKSLVIAYFCTYSYSSSVEYESILKTTLVQVIRLYPDLVAHAYHQLIMAKRLPSAQVLMQLIRNLMASAALLS